jgi:hypothetical protein
MTHPLQGTRKNGVINPGVTAPSLGIDGASSLPTWGDISRTETRNMRYAIRLALLGGAALALVGASTALANGAGGVSGPAFYVDGQLYRTVGTPTDLSHTGAPDHSFDTIYEFQGLQLNVAEGGPGDRGYNGGRWRVQVLTFTDYDAAVETYDANSSGGFDSDEEVEAAISAGAAMTSDGPSFVCPVIKLPRGQGN